MAAFEIGKILYSRAVYARMRNDAAFKQFVTLSFQGRYIHGDWGDISVREKMANNQTMMSEGAEISAIYHRRGFPNDSLQITTEWDRSTTHVRFLNECV